MSSVFTYLQQQDLKVPRGSDQKYLSVSRTTALCDESGLLLRVAKIWRVSGLNRG